MRHLGSLLTKIARKLFMVLDVCLYDKNISETEMCSVRVTIDVYVLQNIQTLLIIIILN